MPNQQNGSCRQREELIRLLDTYDACVYKCAYVILRDHALAKDVRQEVVLKAIRLVELVLGHSHPKALLLRFTRNKAIDIARMRGCYNKRFHQHPDDTLTIEDAQSREAAPDTELLNDELRSQVRDAISQLDEKYREIFDMYCIGGMKPQDIAETKDLPLGTVKSRIHRAKMRLVETLRDYAGAKLD